MIIHLERSIYLRWLLISRAIFISDDLVIFCCCCCCFLDVIFVDVDCESNIESGWQNLAAFHQGPKWSWKFSSRAYLQFSRQIRRSEAQKNQNFPDPVIWWGSRSLHLLSVSFEGPLTCWMSVLRVPSLAQCQFWGSPHSPDVSFEGPLTCWMSVLRVPSLAGCQFLEGPLTCLDVMWSLFWSKLDLKMKIWPTSGRFGENYLLKLVLVCPILTQWWNKKIGFTSPLT